MDSSIKSVNEGFIKLPLNITPLSHQLAGHFYDETSDKLGLLKDNKTNYILKPIVSERGERERNFYDEIFSLRKSNYKNLIPFLSRPHGFIEISNVCFLQLEDACDEFDGLCDNMDVKIGYRTYDPHATKEKIESEKAKYIWGEKLGFRISGLRVNNPNTKEITYYDKLKGREMDPDAVVDAFRLFFGLKFYKKTINEIILKSYLSQLKQLQKWFLEDNLNQFYFFSSSLLFIHSIEPQLKTIVKMIDFAHVYSNDNNDDQTPYNSPLDTNYINGLNKLIDILNELLEQCK